MITEELKSLGAIDFLPQQYREAKIKRSASVWRLLLVFALAAMLVSTTLLQRKRLHDATVDLAKVDLMYAASKNLATEIAEEQSRFPAANAEAELFTLLRHPWPRTQILKAALSSVPKPVRLTSLRIENEVPEKPRGEIIPETPQLSPSNPSAEQDLKALRSRLADCQWVMSLSGTTSDLAELHVYLAELEHQKLFAKVELVSVESPSSESGLLRFTIRIVLRPGYGMPGGPGITAESTSSA